MMTKAPQSPIIAALERFLPGLKYPYLFLILGGLLAADLVLPDPIPLFDELGLAILTLLVGAWRTRREPDLPPRDVTPPDDPPPRLPGE
jgi:hypothetical protein